MNDLNTKVLFSQDEIKSRVAEIGKAISQDYGDQTVTVVAVLKGSIVFMTDLIRTISSPLEIDFIGVSSYEGTQSTGAVRISHDLKTDISGRHVLLVEDIVDTGLTIDYLVKLLQARGPSSIKVCSLLSKPESHKLETKIDYCGFEISKEFVVGYGLDLDEQYRQVPDILQIIED